jgi:hypothetical protein
MVIALAMPAAPRILGYDLHQVVILDSRTRARHGLNHGEHLWVKVGFS